MKKIKKNMLVNLKSAASVIKKISSESVKIKHKFIKAQSENSHAIISETTKSEQERNIKRKINSVFLPQAKFSYIIIYKCAYSKTLDVLMDALTQGLVKNCSHNEFRTLLVPMDQYSNEAIENIIKSPEFFTFGFVRNPYERILANYKNKFLEIKTKEQMSDYIKNIWPIDLKIRDMFNLELTLPLYINHQPVSFEHFVKYICSQEYSEMNDHWYPQHRILFNDVPFKLDFIGHVESYIEDMTFVLHKIEELNGVKFDLKYYDNLAIKRNATKQTTLKSYYTPELKELVYNKFKKDFEAFGYSKEFIE